MCVTRYKCIHISETKLHYPSTISITMIKSQLWYKSESYTIIAVIFFVISSVVIKFLLTLDITVIIG